MFGFKKKKEVKRILTGGQDVARKVAIVKHQNRVDNLLEELTQIHRNLKINEGDFDKTKNEREKISDTFIRKMTILQYEIDIREGLIKWLS